MKGEFYGIAQPGIAYATWIQESGCLFGGDYIFVDNLTFQPASAAPIIGNE